VTVRGAILFVASILAGCTDVGPRRGPGTLQATLDSPNGPEGAAVLVLVGEGVLGVSPLGESDVHSITVGEATRVVVINQAGGTLSFEVTMADLARPLVALVHEVAGPDDELRSDLSAYRVELQR